MTCVQLLVIGAIWIVFAYLLFGNALIGGIIKVHDKRLQQIYNLLRSKKANDVKSGKSSNSGGFINDIVEKIPPEVIGNLVQSFMAPKKPKGGETVIDI